MYFARGADEFDSLSLRQGDILTGIPFPLLDHNSLIVLGSLPPEYDYAALPPIAAKTHIHRFDREWVTAQASVRFCTCAVLSNCCDLEPRNGQIQARMVTLARLRPISNDIRRDPERFASLQANKNPNDQVDPGYIDFFYLEPHELLQNQDWNVEFAQVVSIPASDNNLMLRKKILQLDDRTRVKFKIKLAYTVGRTNDDEEGLENPWLEPAPEEAAPQEAIAEAPAPGETESG